MLGERIKQLRTSRNIKQFELAEKLCVSQSTVAGWESGARKPDVEMVSRISDVLGVTMDYLLGKEEEKPIKLKIDDNDLKFALFGDPHNITDEQFEEVKRFARYIEENYHNKD